MNACSKCGKENQSYYKFCLGCGAELPQAPNQTSAPPSKDKICGKCNARVPAEFRFCGSCGAAFSSEEPAEPTPLPTPPRSIRVELPERYKPTKRDIPRPARVYITKSDGALRVEYNPPTQLSAYVMLAIGALPLLGILRTLSEFFPAGGETHKHERFFEWVVVLFEVGAMGLVLLALLAVGIPAALEKTVLEVSAAPPKANDPFRSGASAHDNRKISRHQRGLRKSSVEYSCYGIQQLYCAKRIDANTQAVTYDLIATYQEYRAEVILAGIYELDTARYLEGQLEEVLQLEDKPISAEA